MKGDRHPDKLRMKSTQGFTLIELMVVMVIVGILATGVVFMFANPSAKSKNQAFNLLGELNMARSEAVSENQDVLVHFIDDVDGVGTDVDGDPKCSEDNITECTPGSGTFDGYIICFDDDTNGDCDGADTLIKVTLFRKEVQYYDPTALPAGPGPALTPGGANLIGKSGIVLDDVAATEVNNFSMEPDGTLEDGITENINVVIFVPKETHNVIYGAPYAITISSGTGRVILERWTYAGVWGRK